MFNETMSNGYSPSLSISSNDMCYNAYRDDADAPPVVSTIWKKLGTVYMNKTFEISAFVDSSLNENKNPGSFLKSN